MPLIKVELTQAAYERLCQEAIRQRRPIPWEAEVRLMRSLRLPLMPNEAPKRRTRVTDAPAALLSAGTGATVAGDG